MAKTDTMNSWYQIQQGVRDTEKLIGQKQNNSAMTKARQTLEYMVKCLAARNNITEGDLIDTIDELYRTHVISRTTCEHYHKIRMIGNKAAHENDDSSINANTAYHMLSQEVYTFANDYSPKSSSRPLTRRKRPAAKTSFLSSPYDLLKIIIPVLIIIILIAVIRLANSGPKKGTNASSAGASSAVTNQTSAQAPEATTATTVEVTSAAALIYKTTSSLNVRSAPSKDAEKLATLPKDTTVEYVGAYNNEWTIINYNGGQAYVFSQYLSSSPAETAQTPAPAPADSEAPPAQ